MANERRTFRRSDDELLGPAGRSSRRDALKTLGAGALALGSGSCGSRTTHDPQTMSVLLNAEAEHLDPRYPGDALGSTIARLVYGSLLDTDPVTFEPRMQLAQTVELVDPTTVRVRLRPETRFHDGSEMTAADVVATYGAVLEPARASTLRGTFERVFRGVRATDPLTVEFALRGPDGTYPSLMQLPIMRARDTLTGEIPATVGNESRFVGSGVMRVRSLARGAWELQRIAPAEGRARVIRFLTMHDPNTLALRLLHGDADIAELKPELFDVFARRRGFQVAHAPSVGFTYLGVRNDHPALRSREVRQAIALAIDRSSLRAGKLGPFAVESSGPIPPTHWAYEPNVQRYPFDPARAREILDRALPRGADGAPRTRLVLRCTTVRFAFTVARAVAAMLAEVGIDVDVRASDLTTLLADLRGARYDLTLMTMPDLSDPWGLAWLFSSEARPTPENPRAGGNRWRYSNPALDAVFEQGRRGVGPAVRRGPYAIAQRILAEDLPVIPLWHADLVFAAGQRVGEFRPRGDSQLDFLLDVPLRG